MQDKSKLTLNKSNNNNKNNNNSSSNGCDSSTKEWRTFFPFFRRTRRVPFKEATWLATIYGGSRDISQVKDFKNSQGKKEMLLSFLLTTTKT